ncbi:EexN family lipoprotein [Sphingomonas glacialis]|nr:EexN family lipoprotein [Sphingomonas glacialis]
MNVIMLALLLATAGLLAGCAKPQPRAVRYFAAHLDEANGVASDCRTGAVRGEECQNADTALEADTAAKRFKHFRGN